MAERVVGELPEEPVGREVDGEAGEGRDGAGPALGGGELGAGLGLEDDARPAVVARRVGRIGDGAG